jgi:hypothetical protein
MVRARNGPSSDRNARTGVRSVMSSKIASAGFRFRISGVDGLFEIGNQTHKRNGVHSEAKSTTILSSPGNMFPASSSFVNELSVYCTSSFSSMRPPS